MTTDQPDRTSLPQRTRQIELASRPVGVPTPDSFRLTEVDLAPLGDAEVLVRNLAMSVDPYMRGRMNDTRSYLPPFALDQPLAGGAVGEVIASRAVQVPVGATVLHGLGWREHAVVPASSVRVVDVTTVAPSTYLGALGMPGLTAYAGLIGVARFRPGDAVFVSGAAGAVGSLVGQIARLMGASRVIGSAGSDQKVAYLRELGFDAAFSYRAGPVADQLVQAAPEGLDVYFDNVGGEHLEAAIGSLHVAGRVAMCGSISAYNATEPPAAPRNLGLVVGKQLTLTGFMVGSWEHLRDEFVGRMSGWMADGSIRFDETVRHGLEQAPEAFIGMLAGQNTGKMVVTLAPRSLGPADHGGTVDMVRAGY